MAEIYKYLPEIIDHYKKGGNVMQFIREIKKTNTNELEDILISYDLQSGSYIKLLKENAEIRTHYCELLAEEIKNLGNFNTLLEVGVGEGITINELLKHCTSFTTVFGFDISFSRLLYAKKHLNQAHLKQTEINLFVADLFNIPLADDSIDIVYTSHSIEPNGGKEKEAINELFRVCKDYLILLEPAYDLASEEAKQRMRNHGYAIRLYDECINDEFEIVKHELFGNSPNKLNPTGITIIKKGARNPAIIENKFICPITKKSLGENKNGLYTKDSGLLYPVIEKIPQLTSSNAILATHLDDFEKDIL